MRFTLVAYDDEAVVFDAASGDTHYLSPLYCAVYRYAATGATADAVCVALDKEFDIDDAGQLSVSVDTALTHLQKLGLLSDA